MDSKKNILFLCTGNSCRSQMAEGWAKTLHGDKFNFYSAGTVKHGLNPWAVKVMKNHGVDISNHESKTLEDLSHISFDYVFTVCSNAHETCPVFTGTKLIHVGFEDPPRLAKGISDETEVLAIYDKVCTEIKAFITAIDTHL